jgi:hypothetical protein
MVASRYRTVPFREGWDGPAYRKSLQYLLSRANREHGPNKLRLQLMQRLASQASISPGYLMRFERIQGFHSPAYDNFTVGPILYHRSSWQAAFMVYCTLSCESQALPDTASEPQTYNLPLLDNHDHNLSCTVGAFDVLAIAPNTYTTCNFTAVTQL